MTAPLSPSTDRLLLGGRSWDPNVFLPGGRSWDCTANLFLHRVWSVTKQHTMSTSASGAASAFGTGPSRYILNSFCLIFSMSTIIFDMSITSLSSDKIAQVHICATTLLIIFF